MGFMSTNIKIGISVATAILLLAFLYFWHYKPISEIEGLRETAKDQVKVIEGHKYTTKKDVFEEKQKAIKDTLTHEEEKPYEEINTSVGAHTIIID